MLYKTTADIFNQLLCPRHSETFLGGKGATHNKPDTLRGGLRGGRYKFRDRK